MKFVAAGFFHLEQNHVADQIEQAFLELLVLRGGFQLRKMIFHLPLRGEFRLQQIISAGLRHQELALHLFRVRRRKFLPGPRR